MIIPLNKIDILAHNKNKDFFAQIKHFKKRILWKKIELTINFYLHIPPKFSELTVVNGVVFVFVDVVVLAKASLN